MLCAKNICYKMELKSEIEYDFETTDLTISNKKCGEIFVKTDETFYIVCRFCIIPFTELTQFTTHYTHNHSDKCNNISDKECEEIDPIKIEPYDGFSDSNSNGSTSEINQCNDGEPNIIASNGNDDLLLLDETNEIVKSTITRNKEILNKSRSRKTKLNFNCDLCGKKFLSEENVEKHKKYDHLPLDPFMDSENVNNDSIEIDPKKCRYCDRKCSNKSLRIIHERKHTGETPFKCEFCNKLFSARKYLKAHEKVHTGIKPYQCDMCDKSFAEKSNFIVHRRRHTGEKCYSCSYCDKTFCDSTEKKIHERVHTGERPYQCNSCGQCFTVISHLHNHTRSFHLSETEYTKPHKCEVCGKSFLTTGTLKDHVAKHTDLRPFSCEICTKPFKTKKALNVHKQIHSSEMKYICQLCGKEFKQYPGLYGHMKSHGMSKIKKT